MKFSRIVLPLTPAQTTRAVELFASGMVALTEQEKALYFEACVEWQRRIQEAAQLRQKGLTNEN